MSRRAESFWNEMFADDHYRYGTAPNTFLADTLPAHVSPPAEVLVLAAGEGRNAVWLAAQGFDVTAVEASGRGLEKMQALMRGAGVHVRSLHADFADWEPEPGRYDAVTLIYAHLPDGLRQETHRKAIDALTPGGHLFLEAFTPDQLQYTSGGPRDRAMLYTEALILEDFGDLHPVLLEERHVQLAEGPGHTGEAAVLRFIGRR